MIKRVNYGKNTPLSFREYLAFDIESPYIIRYKEFLSDDIAPPHYVNALEVLICCGVTGAVIIEGQRFDLIGDIMTIAIPPNAVHSVQINKGVGHIYVLHVSLTDLSHLINIPALLRLCGKKLNHINSIPAQSIEYLKLAEELIAKDSEPMTRIRILFEIFEKLEQHIPRDNITVNSQNEELKRIISWTEENFKRVISLEDVAKEICLSKNYFCSWFKQQTGMTYHSYLTRFRIDNACQMLKKGKSVTDTCYASGFSDASYFTQLFKRIKNCTPKQYISS